MGKNICDIDSLKAAIIINDNSVSLLEGYIIDYIVVFSQILLSNVELKIVGCTFKSECKFEELNLAKLEIERCSFEEAVVFGLANDQKSYCTIKNLSLEDITFAGHAHLSQCIISEKLNISSCNFERNAYFDSLNCESLNFLYNSFVGLISFNSAEIRHISIHSCNVEKRITLAQTNIKPKGIVDRATANVLKNEAIKENDNFLAIQFKAEELRCYQKEVPRKNIAERFMLFLNRRSTSYGRYWLQGVGFILCCTTVFFVLMNYVGIDQSSKLFVFNWRFWECESWCGFGYVVKDYLKVLNVFNFNDTIKGFTFNVWGEMLFILSKIFIGYGIYQTIAAFRKYGK